MATCRRADNPDALRIHFPFRRPRTDEPDGAGRVQQQTNGYRADKGLGLDGWQRPGRAGTKGAE